MRSDHLFVYGTLLPGHLRWGLLAPDAVGWSPATVPGELWDTGRGWPAARFDPSSDTVVPGMVVEFAEHRLREMLADLDEMEGLGDPPDPLVDPYVRMRVGAAGRRAWAYHATRIGARWTRVRSWEGHDER
ncbi:MAG: gamma-glutamylcyclotransferase [Acidimicrobiales bacterium]|nr:gamma-glutamylcyclotransferase [Acidimicrobiales bacterium]